MVDSRSEFARLKEVNAVEVRYVDSSIKEINVASCMIHVVSHVVVREVEPAVGDWRIGAVLLNVHAEKADVNSVDLLKSEHRLRSIRKRLLHLASINEPASHVNTGVTKNVLHNFKKEKWELRTTVSVYAIYESPQLVYLCFIPGFTSTNLSELDSTRIVTSPAPEFFFFRNEFTRFSKYVPSLVVGKPIKRIKTFSAKSSMNNQVKLEMLQFAYVWQCICCPFALIPWLLNSYHRRSLGAKWRRGEGRKPGVVFCHSLDIRRTWTQQNMTSEKLSAEL